MTDKISRMRNIPPDFPACMFIPIIVSCRPSCRLSYEHRRNLDQNPCRNHATDRARGAILLAEVTGERTRFSRSARVLAFSPLSPPPPIVFNICLFLSERENSGPVRNPEEKPGSLRPVARIHDLSSRGLPPREDREPI